MILHNDASILLLAEIENGLNLQVHTDLYVLRLFMFWWQMMEMYCHWQ